MFKSDVIIVGTGHGGAQCAIALRQNKYFGSITMFGRESEPPYERPPLSKEYLSGEKPFERLHIRPPQFWAEKQIDLQLGVTVISVSPEQKLVTLSNGDIWQYGDLVWATGGDPRKFPLPGGNLSGVHTMRTRADCDQLIREIDSGVRNIVIVGGGYIGLEAAAVLTKMDCKVILLEALPRVLGRVAGPELSAFFEKEHRARGVDLRTDVSIASLVGQTNMTGVELSDGSILNADAVIVGIGIVPAVQPLVAAGAAGDNGVDIDEYCRTSLPNIYAIGDCAAFACDYAEGHVMRIESVQNASDQGTCVAKALCGDKQPYRALPWFWSNQYDLRLQTAGISIGYDQTVVRGDLNTRAFSVVYLKHGRIIALDCVNKVKDFAQGRKLVELGACPNIEMLSNSDIPLSELHDENAV